MKPTDHFISSFLELRDSFDKASVVLPKALRQSLLNEMKEQFEIVQNARTAGEDLSAPISLVPFARYFQVMASLQAGMESQAEYRATGVAAQRDLFADQPQHNPNSWAFYTKPVYMIIDPIDFSGGDATPASLKDYGRVTLLGLRTAGAGGTVEEFNQRFLNTQFSFHMTTSLMYRKVMALMGMNPYVENAGVEPHIEFMPTEADYTDGMASFLPRALKLISTDMKEKEAARPRPNYITPAQGQGSWVHGQR